MRDVLRSSKARVTTSSADVLSEVGRGRDLKRRSASTMRALIAAAESWRAAGGVLSSESATGRVEAFGAGGGSSSRGDDVTVRARVPDGSAVCDCAGTELVRKREAETAKKAKIVFIR